MKKKKIKYILFLFNKDNSNPLNPEFIDLKRTNLNHTPFDIPSQVI